MHTVASSDLALASRSLYTPPPTPASRLGKHMYVHKMVFKMKLRIRNVAIKQAERKAPNKVNGILQCSPSLILAILILAR